MKRLVMKLPLLGVLGVLMLAAAAPLWAQDKPNAMGISFHHLSFEVPDYDANIDFWKKFGGVQQIMQGRGRFSVFHFTGEDVVIGVMENTANSGGSVGSVGSVIDHFGFQVPDVAAAVARWKAAGLRVEPGQNAQQAYVYTPDNVKIEILENASLKVPLKPHHVHFFTAAPSQTRAWYVKMFGGVPGQRAIFEVADVPDMDLAFSQASGAVVPTKGRALDHIGFAVTNLQDTQRRLKANGVHFEAPLRGGAGPGAARIAMFVDPWGTRVELIQLPAGG